MAKTHTRSNMNMVSSLKRKSEIFNRENNNDKYLGIASMSSYLGSVSAGRGLMYNKNVKQTPIQCNPDIPIIATGRENLLSAHSIGHKTSDANYEVIRKIIKYPDNPDDVYSLILFNTETGEFHLLEKYPIENLTESYGFPYISNIDDKEENDVIEKGELLMKSTSFDNSDNYCFGKNIPTIYMIDPILEEDGIMINSEYADDFKFWKVHCPRIVLNENDILGNQYYTDDIPYKAFPDIGEDLNGLVTVIRRIDHKASFHTMKDDVLKDILPDDLILNPSNGTVVDIKVYSNCFVNELVDEVHSAQLNKYARIQYNYMKNIVDAVDELNIPDDKFSSDLGYYYNLYRNGIDPEVKWVDDYKSTFSHMCIEFTILEKKKMNIGSKCTGRFGDKGVIVKMCEPEDMPHVKCLKNGKYELVPVGMACNGLGVPGRTNPVQLINIMLTHISRQLLEYTRTKCDTLGEKRKIIFKYLNIVSPFYSDSIVSMYKTLSKEDKVHLIREFESKEYIRVIIPPLYNRMGLQMLSELLIEFKDIIHREELYQKNSKGRLIKCEDKTVFGIKHVLRLKHEPDTKFSARGTGTISSTTNLPNKSNRSKKYKEPYSDTPIKMGKMEFLLMFLDINGIETTQKMKAYLSDYPISRRDPALFVADNPFDIDCLPVNEEEENRPKEMLNTFLSGELLYLGDLDERNSKIKKNHRKDC